MSVKSDAIKRVKDILAGSKCPQLLLISAHDQVRRRRITKLLLEKFAIGIGAEDIKRVDLSSIDASGITTLLEELNSLSLFSPKRFFVLDKFDAVAAAMQKQLLSLFDDLAQGVTVIALSKPLPASNAVQKFFSKNGESISLPQLEGFELKRWIQKEIKQNGVQKFSEKSVDQIAAVAEGDLDHVAAAVEHLSLLLDDNEALELSHVETLFPHHKDPSEFTLLELLAEGKSVQAELLLIKLLRSGKSPFALVGLLAKSFSRNLAISWLQDHGLNQTEIRQKLGVPPWLFQKQLSAIRRYKSPRLVHCLLATLSADAKLKNHSLGAEAIFSELAGRLTP
ncbi:MAG: DNA polymerase III subunit delta [Deltaproteobacteria bacterium]|nr:DNA polymerase III subunit delta [Deltaproteobacteria bacterium]